MKPYYDYTVILADGSIREKAQSAYNELGYIVVENALSEKELIGVRNVLDNIAESRASKKMDPFVSHLMPHTWDDRIFKVAQKKSIVSSVEMLLGGRVNLLHSQLTFKAPGDIGFSIHQDNYFNRAKPSDSIVAAWLALDNANQKNGALLAYPGSHTEGVLPVKKNWHYMFNKGPQMIAKVVSQTFSEKKLGYEQPSGVVEQLANTVVPDKYKPITLEAKAGSLVFMHGDLIHSSGKNLTKNQFRRNLLFNYILQGSKYKAGLLSKRVPLSVYQ